MNTKSKTKTIKVEKNKEKTCVECGSTEPDVKKHSGILVCDQCSDMDKYTNICKSTALKEYKLTENDLNNIQYQEVKNPHYSCAKPMKLYNLLEIKNYACLKHETDLDNLEDKIQELKETKSKKSNSENVEKRKRGLLRALQKQSIELNPDDYSEEIEKYLESGKGTIKKIIQPYLKTRRIIETFGNDSVNDSLIMEMIHGSDEMDQLIHRIRQYRDRKNELILALETIDKEDNDIITMEDMSDGCPDETKSYLVTGNPKLPCLFEMAKKRKESKQRKEELRKRLNEHGLDIRSDSMFCTEYIEHNLRTLQEVVDMMCEMDWFFKNTNYRNVLKMSRRSWYNEDYQSNDKYHYLINRCKIDKDDCYLHEKISALCAWIDSGRPGTPAPKHMDQMIKCAEDVIQKYQNNNHKKIKIRSK